jgi:predicted cation transporter
MMPVYIALVVALICFILYALDRRMKSEPIEWMSASKLTLLGGLLSGGIAYTVSSPEVVTETVTAAVAAAAPAAESAQEMFVGVPTF